MSLKTYGLYQNPYADIHSNLIYNNQHMETTQKPIDE